MLVVAHSKCKKKTHSSLAVRAVLEYVAAVGGLEHEQLNYNHTQRPRYQPRPLYRDCKSLFVKETPTWI